MSRDPARGLVLRMRHTRRRDTHTVHAALELQSETLADARVEFAYELSTADREALSWYWEDLGDEAALMIDPAAAQEAETRLRGIGEALFRHVFGEDQDARQLWSRASARLEDLRVELASGPREASAIPWELLWDPRRGERPVLGVRAFVRTTRGLPTAPRRPPRREGIAVLYVAAPSDDAAVPFRSVVAGLLRTAGVDRDLLEVDVLRSPTFDALREHLVKADESGRPYDVVHFDGDAMTAADSDERAALVFSAEHGRFHVSGRHLGDLLVRTGVRALVLNAAQAVHEEAPAAPDLVPARVERRPRAFVSVAAEATEAGLPAVIALPYCAGSRALEFCSALYEMLLEGRALGEAVCDVRRRMSEGHDWLVPVVAFEPAPLRLVEASPRHAGVDLGRGADDPEPDFVGRDDLVLALDRAFVDSNLVLLHGEAGSGKTSTATAFTSWYKSSGALRVDGGGEGAVLFSVLDERVTPSRVLDELGEMFRSVLESAGVHWMQLGERDRGEVAAQVLRQVPVVWVWDGADSLAAAGAEQRAALRDLLRRVTDAGARVLVTSRDPEHDWLGELPRRIEMTPLPWRDRVALARTVVSSESPDRRDDVERLEPLLRYADGNPMATSAMVRLALREGVATREDTARLLGQLQDDVHAGEPLPDGLGAALRHSLRREFTADERAQLALLGLFERHVDVDVLRLLGVLAERAGASVPGGDAERGELVTLLDRATDVGLVEARGNGYYRIHDAISPLLYELFKDTYEGTDVAALRESWVHAVASVGEYWYGEYRERRMLDLAPLAAEEQNLLRARRLGMSLGLWEAVTSCMNAVWLLYRHAGRMPELGPLVEELAGALVEPGTDRPQPGFEEEWRSVVAYRVSLARATRDVARAVELQKAMVEWERRRVADTGEERLVAELAHAIEDLGDLLREADREDCVASYQEAYELFGSIDAALDQSRAAHSIANAHLSLGSLVDYDLASEWLHRSLALAPEDDHLGRSRTLAQLGRVAFAREDFGAALEAYEQALAEMPADATSDIAVTRAQLGNVYGRFGDLEASLESYRTAVAQYERIGDIYGAGLTRYNLAVTLGGGGQIDAAIRYARAALRDLEMTGDTGRGDLQDARELVGVLEGMQETSAG